MVLPKYGWVLVAWNRQVVRERRSELRPISSEERRPWSGASREPAAGYGNGAEASVMSRTRGFATLRM